jgi:hypothetical protein
MSFADIPDEQTNGNDEYRKTHYTKITSDYPIRLRILNKEAVHQKKYFLPKQRLSIIAPENEENDPIWQRNGRLMKENPDKSPNQIKGWISRQNRYMVNVLNRTMVKRAPQSGNVVFPGQNGFPTHDPESGELISDVDPTPLNRVEVLERGPTLFSQLNQINSATCDEAGNPIGIWNYDIVISATGKGRHMVTNIIPYPNKNDEIDLDELELYDLEEVGLRLEPDEIERVLNGVQLRDIFAARRGEDTTETDTDDDMSFESDVDDSDIQAGIDSLFGDS